MTLTASEMSFVTESLARMGLIGRDEHLALAALTGGVSSMIVRADTARGPLCIKCALPRLKVAAEWLAPVERNSAEVAWLRLAARIVPGSAPQILGQDETAQAFAMSYLDPPDIRHGRPQLRDGIIETATAQAVARNLAAIHNATARQEDIARTFANDSTFYDIRLEPYFAATARAHADCAPTLERIIARTAPNQTSARPW